MFELTNDQRKYFAIPPVEDSWEKVEVLNAVQAIVGLNQQP